MPVWKDDQGNRYDATGRLIVVHTPLSGSKVAIRRGSRLYVSPAMMTLIRDCDNPDDHYALLSNIRVRVLSQSHPLPLPGDSKL